MVSYNIWFQNAQVHLGPRHPDDCWRPIWTIWTKPAPAASLLSTCRPVNKCTPEIFLKNFSKLPFVTYNSWRTEQFQILQHSVQILGVKILFLCVIGQLNSPDILWIFHSYAPFQMSLPFDSNMAWRSNYLFNSETDTAQSIFLQLWFLNSLCFL